MISIFRLIGSKKYDDRVSKYIQQRFYSQSVALPTALSALAYWREDLINLSFLQIEKFALGKTIMEEFGIQMVTNCLYGTLTALFAFGLYRKLVDFPRRYVSGMFITLDGECSVKYFKLIRDGTRFKTVPMFATILSGDTIFIEGGEANASIFRPVPFIVLDSDVPSKLNDLRLWQLKKILTKNVTELNKAAPASVGPDRPKQRIEMFR